MDTVAPSKTSAHTQETKFSNRMYNVKWEILQKYINQGNDPIDKGSNSMKKGEMAEK